MAHAAVSSIWYPPFIEGDPGINAQIDCVIAGSDVAGGRHYVGLIFDVDPTNDSPNTLKDKVGGAVRNYATNQCPNASGGSGVTIGVNAILMGDFTKG